MRRWRAGRQASSVSLQRLFLCIVLVVGLSNAVAAGTIQLVIATRFSVSAGGLQTPLLLDSARRNGVATGIAARMPSTCHRLRPTLNSKEPKKSRARCNKLCNHA